MGNAGLNARHARRHVELVAITAVAALAMLAGCGDDAAEIDEHEYGSIVITQWNDSTELFLEYPHLLAGEAMGNWAIHLSSMKDFKPITTGSLTVRFLGAGGAA